MAGKRSSGCPACGRTVPGDGSRGGLCPHCSALLAPADGAEGRALFARPLLRLAGYLVDAAVTAPALVVALYVGGVLEATGRAGPGVFLSALTWMSLACVVYYIVPTAIWGQTVGKWVAGTKVVGPDGNVPGWKRATIRGVVAAFADLLFNTVVIGILDPLWLLWDPRRQALHDKAASTVVVTVRRRRPVLTFVASLILGIGAQVGLVFGAVRPFIVQAYYVPSGSMLPTLQLHDRLMVNKLSYRYGDLRRGDVIVFTAPLSALYANPTANPDLGERKDFIKRLVALPGDTVKVKDGRLFLKTAREKALHTVEEPYLDEPFIEGHWGPVTVPDGHVLVFGDNRNNSNDSRRWIEPAGEDARGRPKARAAPFLPIGNIHGRAFYRYWPPWRWGELPRGGL